MISMQQLEELETRVVKALQLIGDLRSENSKLESDNENLKGEVEEVKLTLEEKEQEIAKIKRELDNSTRELNEIKERGEELEKKIIGLLGKLDVVQSGGVPSGTITSSPAPASDAPQGRTETISATDYESDFLDDEDDLTLKSSTEYDSDDETLTSSDTADDFKEHDEVILEAGDEGVFNKETIESTEGFSSADDDDYIVIIDDDDEIPVEAMGDGDSNDDLIKVDGIDDDDDFLIMEDEDK